MTGLQLASPLSPASARTLAHALGWFSIALGLAQLAAPRALAGWLGMRGSEPALRAYGVREIGTGAAILASENPSDWMWGRVAGDAIDLSTLAAGLRKEEARKGNIGVALAAVLGITVLDALCAEALTAAAGQARRMHERTARAYRHRSGFPRPVAAMRGAARDFQPPADMRTPEPLRPYAI